MAVPRLPEIGAEGYRLLCRERAHPVTRHLVAPRSGRVGPDGLRGNRGVRLAPDGGVALFRSTCWYRQLCAGACPGVDHSGCRRAVSRRGVDDRNIGVGRRDDARRLFPPTVLGSGQLGATNYQRPGPCPVRRDVQQHGDLRGHRHIGADRLRWLLACGRRLRAGPGPGNALPERGSPVGRGAARRPSGQPAPPAAVRLTLPVSGAARPISRRRCAPTGESARSF